MSPEELLDLSEKIKNNTATASEKLKMLKELNLFLETLKADINNFEKNGTETE